MADSETITVLSLCTGYGGLELGLSRALENPMRVVAVEIEAFTLANLAAKAQEGKLAIEAMWPDLRTFSAERFRECFDFVIAGYPCQPFSTAGKRQGTADPRHLWPHIARIVQAVRPVWCFFENVPGHLTLGFPKVYRSLRDMGYSVEAGLFTAAEVGTPHRRQRLFILANTEGGRYGGRPLRVRKNGNHISEKVTDNRGNLPSEANGCRWPGPAIDGDIVAVACGPELSQRQRKRSDNGTQRQAATGSCSLWPARLGQPQYEWEEPRTVEPGLGGAANGPRSRVDRLRLLGNGVVPQQAEKAFRCLMEKFDG